ncbi:MAG TPA: RidA family protein [Candidatus Baltobacteraceae bacterium]
MSITAEARLKQLGIELGPPPKPAGNYVPYVITGNLLYVSGNGPRLPDGRFKSGKVGREVTPEDAYDDARLVGIVILGIVRTALGSLDRVKRVVKLFGMVNAVPEFTDHPNVINGCSDLFVEIFGENGRHARSAVGMGSLPIQITVEIEAIFEISPEV